MDGSGHIRDETTGRFAPMEDYLLQLMEEAIALEEIAEEEPEAEVFGFEDLNLDDFPDYELDPGDEVEFTVDVTYEETVQ
jgi:uncharacterized cupredoxin-like copper-binding protein